MGIYVQEGVIVCDLLGVVCTDATRLTRENQTLKLEVERLGNEKTTVKSQLKETC